MRGLRAALIGHPVAHSRSPLLHSVAGRWVGLPVRYDLIDSSPAALAPTLTRLVRGDLDGFNVTAPHKTDVFDWLRARTDGGLTPAAQAIGAVNTVYREGERWMGDNTDLYGFLSALPTRPIIRAVVLGAGGAARAVVAALATLNIDQRVLNRDPTRAQALVDTLGRGATAGALDTLSAALQGADLLVNALPPQIAAELLDAHALAALAPGAHVMDLNYGPRAQPVLDLARRAGLDASDGLAMLAGQGIAAFTRWTGLHPPPRPVLKALQDEGVGS